jgi:hypothetical protein
MVSHDIGLGAAMPNASHDPAWEATLVFNSPSTLTRSFTMRSTKIGFNPKGRFLHLGYTHENEDLFLALAPRSYVDEPSNLSMLDDLEFSLEQTAMEKRHRCAVMLFLAHVLKQVTNLPIILMNRYPDLDDADALLQATSIW